MGATVELPNYMVLLLESENNNNEYIQNLSSTKNIEIMPTQHPNINSTSLYSPTKVRQ